MWNIKQEFLSSLWQGMNENEADFSQGKSLHSTLLKILCGFMF